MAAPVVTIQFVELGAEEDPKPQSTKTQGVGHPASHTGEKSPIPLVRMWLYDPRPPRATTQECVHQGLAAGTP